MRRLGLMVLATGGFACGGSDVTGPGDFSFTFDDPIGDTASVQTGTGAIDLVQLNGTVGPITLLFRLTFSRQVTPWSEHKTNALDGFLDLDLDRNPGTGLSGAALAGGGLDSLDLGADAYVDLRDNGHGQVGLLMPSTSGQALTLVSARFDGAHVTIEIPRTALKGFIADSLWAGAVVGSRDLSITDIAPNTGHFEIGRP
ncbi:MAG: hypothetical protein ABI647_15055 [Gemmatimonadota bacterium]